MSKTILILGESGVGKSTAIRTLPADETFIINIINKALPFKGAMKKYNKLSPDGLTGNYYSADDSSAIIRAIELVNKKRPEIKYLIIDDFGFSITQSFMKKAHIKSFEKFNEIGYEAFSVLETVKRLRDDLFCFVTMHTEIDGNGRYKPRTVGKMIDQYIVIEGIFDLVLHALIVDGRHVFLTNNDNVHMAHTAIDMFPTNFIDNDMKLVVDAINDYYNDGEDEE